MTEKKLIADEMGLIDTNILVYALDAVDKEKHERAKWFLKQVALRPGQFVVAMQNLREFSAVMSRKKPVFSALVNECLFGFETAFGAVLWDYLLDFQLALDYCFRVKAPFWDSLLAATMQRNGVRLIYTENERDFAKFPGLKVVNPLK
ncbi:MAG: PIN domain-containing protein [Candidatus Diapherotrites archaeon]|nr:PIN domain-containing protein [Candidatus Diapherotrites archaeon]